MTTYRYCIVAPNDRIHTFEGLEEELTTRGLSWDSAELPSGLVRVYRVSEEQLNSSGTHLLIAAGAAGNFAAYSFELLNLNSLQMATQVRPQDLVWKTLGQ